MNQPSPAIDNGTLLGVFLRSFLVQASWNYRGMQNLGFATMVIPAFHRLGSATPDAIAPEESGFFNTHPFFASAVAGLVLDLRTRPASPATMAGEERNLKESFMGPLGALGDEFFWSGLRPFAATAGVLVGLFGYPLAGLLTFLLLFNVPHLHTRWAGLKSGSAGTAALMSYLRTHDYKAAAHRLIIATGVVAVCIPLAWFRHAPWPCSPWFNAWAATVFLCLAGLLTKRISTRQLALGLFVVLVLLHPLIPH